MHENRAGELVRWIVGLTLLAAVLSPSALLVATWIPDIPWIPPGIRDFVGVTIRHVWAAHQLEPLRGLAIQWDWARLRFAASILVGLEVLGALSLPQVGLPIVGAIRAGVLGLVVLQYGAVGGGQPVWAFGHAVAHVMGLAGFMPSDVAALGQFVHDHVSARSYHPPRLLSQGVLLAVALALTASADFLALLLPMPWRSNGK